MNTVKITNETNSTFRPQPGDIFKVCGMIYILNSNIVTIAKGKSELLYCANNIETGAPWRRALKSIDEAVGGLTFVGRNANITISFNSNK